MKKLLLVLGVALMILGCSEKKNPNLDAFTKGKKIDHDQAVKMKKKYVDNYKNPPAKPTTVTFHWDVYNSVAGIISPDNLFIVPVQYVKEDEDEYRAAWGIPAGDARGNVDGFCSFILQSGTGTDYFEFCTICPPPDDCGTSK